MQRRSNANVLAGRDTSREFDATTRIFDEIVDPMRDTATRSNLGALLRILGEYDSVEQRLRESIRIFADPDSIGEGGEALQLFSARLAAATGEDEDSPPLARSAYSELDTLGARPGGSERRS